MKPIFYTPSQKINSPSRNKKTRRRICKTNSCLKEYFFNFSEKLYNCCANKWHENIGVTPVTQCHLIFNFIYASITINILNKYYHSYHSYDVRKRTSQVSQVSPVSEWKRLFFRIIHPFFPVIRYFFNAISIDLISP